MSQTPSEHILISLVQGQPKQAYSPNHVLTVAQKAMQEQDFDGAEYVLAQCREVATAPIQVWLLSAQNVFIQQDYRKVVTLADQALKRFPNTPVLLEIKGGSQKLLGDLKGAETAWHAATASAVASVNAFKQLGILYQETGQLELARQTFQEAINRFPTHTELLWQQVNLVEDCEAALTYAMSLLPQKAHLDPRQSAYLYYCLGRLNERVENYQKSFEYYKLGARCKGATLSYNHAAARAEIDAIIRHSAAITSMPDVPVNPSNTPVFICGLPRSGTTLVEQILAAHSDVTGGDESFAFPNACRDVLSSLSLSETFPTWFDKLNDSGWRDIGKRYMQATESLQSTHFFTDKNLLNYKVIGPILSAMPQAKIVLCVRNGMDNIFGMYKQLFNDGMAFTYDLNHLTDTYLDFLRLVAHWQETLQDRVYVLNFDALVTSPEVEVAKLLDYVGISWEADCINPAQSDFSSRTLSSMQVKQGINTRGVGHWRHYQSQLQQVEQRLNAESK